MALPRSVEYPKDWVNWPDAEYVEDEEWENHTHVNSDQHLVGVYVFNTEKAAEYFCKDCLQLRLTSVHPILDCNNCGSHRIIRGEVGSLDKEALRVQYKNYKEKHMARIVTVDFAGVESGGSMFIHVPEGDYALEIKKVVGKKGRESGQPNLVFHFELSKGSAKGNGKTIQHNCSLQKQSLWNFRNLLEALGKQVPSKAVKIDVDKLVGLKCAGSVVDGEYNDRKKSEIAMFFPLDQLGKPSTADDLDEEIEEAEKPKKTSKKGAKKAKDEMFGDEGESEESGEETSSEEEDELFS